MNAITNSNYVNYVPVSVSVSSYFIGSRLGLMTPLTAAAYDFDTRYLFSEGCEGRASCNCCEERMSREGGVELRLFLQGEVELRLFLQEEVELRLFLRGNIFSRRGEVELQLLRGNIFSRRGSGCFCKGRSSCDCFCEERMSREGVGRVATVARKYLSRRGKVELRLFL